MKSFRTEFPVPSAPFLGHDRPVLTLGSCFAEHVGQRLLDAKWSGLNAPFGTLFHPLALTRLLHLSLENQDLDANLFVEHDAAFFHHDLHGRFYAPTPEALQKQWHTLAAALRDLVRQNPCVLLTLGTAWVYEKDGRIIANCHKQPAAHFKKSLLEPEEIQASLDQLMRLLPDSPVIISLSPVRHTRDTMVLNSLSKSLLRVSLHRFVERHPERAHYFPAYEIMLDDLRDYRFYEADMIHPSTEAIDYIWEKFMDAYGTDAAKTFLQRWQPIQQFLRHRPQRSESPSSQAYARAILKELESFTTIDCKAEIAACQARIART